VVEVLESVAGQGAIVIIMAQFGNVLLILVDQLGVPLEEKQEVAIPAVLNPQKVKCV